MSDKEVRNNKAKRRISISKIIESYKNGMTYKQIGAEFEVSENAIRNRIVEYEKKTGEKIRRTRTSSKNQNIPIKELFIKYATGEDIEELANKYNISKSEKIMQFDPNNISHSKETFLLIHKKTKMLLGQFVLYSTASQLYISIVTSHYISSNSISQSTSPDLHS